MLHAVVYYNEMPKIWFATPFTQFVGIHTPDYEPLTCGYTYMYNMYNVQDSQSFTHDSQGLKEIYYCFR